MRKGKPPSQKLERSRFREDKNPTCGFYYNKAGWLILHDFSTGEHMNIIEYSRRVFNLSYQRTIDNLINLENQYPKEEVEVVIEDRSVFDYIEKSLEPKYFEQFGISENTLVKYKVKSLRALYINESLVWRGTESNPVYLYEVNGRFKAYKPLTKNKEQKWKSNTKLSDVFGLEQIGEKGKILFITSSLKDVMCLYEMGYPAIAFPSEEFPIKGQSSRIVEEIIAELSNRFEHIMFFLNNDATGKRMSEACSKRYKKGFIVLPEGPKDPSDYYKKYRKRKLRTTINKLIKNEIKRNNRSLGDSSTDLLDFFNSVASEHLAKEELGKIPTD